MQGRVRLGLRLPPNLNRELEEAAREDYMTKNQLAVELFSRWLAERKVRKADNPATTTTAADGQEGA